MQSKSVIICVGNSNIITKDGWHTDFAKNIDIQITSAICFSLLGMDALDRWTREVIGYTLQFMEEHLFIYFKALDSLILK